MSSSSLACLLALLAAVNPTNANNATDAPQQRLLDASLSPGCPTSCSSFHAGASINSTMVCTYAKSGVGYLSETLNQGLACYPAYNCREDWNVCLQWVKNTTHADPPRSPSPPPRPCPTCPTRPCCWPPAKRSRRCRPVVRRAPFLPRAGGNPRRWAGAKGAVTSGAAGVRPTPTLTPLRRFPWPTLAGS